MTLDGGNNNVQQLCILFMSVTLCVLKWQLPTLILWNAVGEVNSPQVMLYSFWFYWALTSLKLYQSFVQRILDQLCLAWILDRILQYLYGNEFLNDFSFLGHDSVRWAGLLTICCAVVWQEQSSWNLSFLVLFLRQVLCIAMACTTYRCTNIGHLLVLSSRRVI